MKNKKIKLLFFFLFLFFLSGNFVDALEINYPRIPGVQTPQDFLNTADPENILSLYIKYLVSLCIWASGVIAFVALVYAGILYLMSTGRPERIIAAKEQIIAAFLGLLIIFSAYFVFQIINPRLSDLTIPPLGVVNIPQPPNIAYPNLQKINTSIDVEIPFGRIIEKIFEIYVSEYPKPEQPWIPRMTRITNNTEATLQIVDSILKQSTKLRDLSNSCRCENTDPDPKCPDAGCTPQCTSLPGACTGDPCKNVRSEITKNEKDNLNQIYGQVTVPQTNAKGKKENIETNLMTEIKKTQEEVRLLKDWLQRLKRAEKAISDCPLRYLNSWSQFSLKKTDLENQNDISRKINFWDDININYYTGQQTKNTYGSWYFVPTKEIKTDTATFYCSVSGTYQQPVRYLEPDVSKVTGEESEEEIEAILSESMACSNEAPVGEVIDRAERITQLLINRLERTVDLDKELIDQINQLHIAISECSSKKCTRGCYPVCTSELNYCVSLGCTGEPCDKTKISNILSNIQKINQEIKDLVNGTGTNDTSQNIGVINIINEVRPGIINDLEEIRYTIKHYNSAFNCVQAQGAIIPPYNEILYKCCQTETIEENQTVYGDCFAECYTETTQKEHRICVQDCLLRNAQQLNDEELPLCIHELNFYICE